LVPLGVAPPVEAVERRNDFTERTHFCPEPEETKPVPSSAPNPISPFAQATHPAGWLPIGERPPVEAVERRNDSTERTHSCPEPEETKPVPSSAPNPISPVAQATHPAGWLPIGKRPPVEAAERSNDFTERTTFLPRGSKKRNPFLAYPDWATREDAQLATPDDALRDASVRAGISPYEIKG
jgi:hypothetical protein